jgi:hypothetical protein
VKVLLLHPEDEFSRFGVRAHYDLIVDLGRTPGSTYERWAQQTNCRVISIYDFAEEVESLYGLRQLLQLGMGKFVDDCGLDWWDLLSLEIASELQHLILIVRLAKELGPGCKLFASHAHFLAAALREVLQAPLNISDGRLRAGLRQMGRYCRRFSRLDLSQILQVLFDKYDGQHLLRRHFTTRTRGSGRPAVLLPTAYINGSRTALAYAALITDFEFLLVAARNCARVESLPANVHAASLSPYFCSSSRREIAGLLESWESLRNELIIRAEPFALADATGIFSRIPRLLAWGIGLRDAWNRFFESENIIGCLCTDDSNPPTRLPLLLAKNRGLPALACHHGALDYSMAFKTHHADFYLAKSEMEEDYLHRICRLEDERIVAVAPHLAASVPVRSTVPSDRPWMVFFSEPYGNAGWRIDEVYGELLPRLSSLARTVGLKLVFKLHPFESIKSHRRMLRHHLGDQGRQIEVIAGPPSGRLWRNIRFGITAQSSVAVECSARGIPIFLCAWLRDPYSGYIDQFARFGVGHILRSPKEIEEIAQVLDRPIKTARSWRTATKANSVEGLANLFRETFSLPGASNS